MLVLVLMENILQVVTEVLSGQEHATISLVMPLLTGLLEVHLVPSKVDDPMTATVKKALHGRLSDRWETVQRSNDSLFILPTYLDPRFKDFHFFHNPIYQNILSGHAEHMLRELVPSGMWFTRYISLPLRHSLNCKCRSGRR